MTVVCLRKLWNLILSDSVKYPKLMDERHLCLHAWTNGVAGLIQRGLVLGLIFVTDWFKSHGLGSTVS